MKIIRFAAGLAVGYVLGSRAGRERYEQIVAAARKAQDHPAVIEVKQKARELVGSAADTTAVEVTPAATTTAPPPRPPRRTPKSTLTGAGTVTDPVV